MNKYLLIVTLIAFLFSCTGKKHPASHKKDAIIDGLILSNQQVQLGHIITDSVKEHILGDELILTGMLTANQNKLTSISSRVMGRIEKLYFKNMGEAIKEGQPIYTIYSEEMAFAVKELKLALEKKRLFQNEFIDIDKIIQTTRYKLSLYGLSDKQIQDIESNDNFSNILTIRSPVSGIITSIDVREGDYVMEGAGIYNIADLSSLWAEAQVYSDNLYQINDNMMATVFVPGISNMQYQGKITFVNPELNPSSTINIIRIEVPNHLQLLRPGMQINVSVLVNKKNTLAVSTDAILLTEKGAYAWIKTGQNQFKSVMVETGIVTNEYTEIKSGLMHGDIVVTSGAYLLNSEYLFNKGTDLMEGHNMKME